MNVIEVNVKSRKWKHYTDLFIIVGFPQGLLVCSFYLIVKPAYKPAGANVYNPCLTYPMKTAL